MSEREEAEIVIRRFIEMIDRGLEDLDVNLLKEAIILGEKYNIDVEKLVVKLKELTNEEVVHLK
ncbi:MAG: hypothetical protein KQA41_03925 [Candidatus Aenigmarchaeota archaeon]|nr:hypothetical protein [Candidatus Aenigmarchaeota archaeon]MBU5689344.1 hypothetical protein [Candidatus Aenigmarchaeota archaeon]